MVSIDALISEMKSLYNVKGDKAVRFDLPDYESFHKNMLSFIYGNHF